MKKSIYLISFFLILFDLHGQNFNFDNIPNHPRILWLEGEEQILKEDINNYEIKRSIHQNIIEKADSIIPIPTLERIQIGRRLLNVSRECLRRVLYLAYAYKISGESKYFKRCEAELLKVSKFSDWNPSHFLDVAEMTLAVSIGYDWLFNSLNDQSRIIIKSAIIDKGLKPSLDSKYNYWLNVSNNWNQVCNAGMTYGALAIFEDDPSFAKQIIERSESSIQLSLADFNPDGAYPEGYSYWNYGTSFHILYLSAMQKINLLPKVMDKGMAKTPYYYLNMLGNSGKPFNYSDAGSSNGNLSPAMFWFAKELNDQSLLFFEKTFALENKNLNDRLLPASLIWSLGMVLNNISEPNNNMFEGQGKSPVAMFRSSWDNLNGIYIGFKTGSPNVNHAHMDIGSFVMDASGERWAIDFGMQNYESIEALGINLWDKRQESDRWKLLRYNNFFHNTLTIDNQLQNVNGYAKIDFHTNRSNFMCVQSDLSELYNDISVKRGIALVDKKYVVVKDEFSRSNSNKKVKWTMVTPATIDKIGKNFVILKQNGKYLTLKVHSSKKIFFKTWETKSDKHYDAPNPGTQIIGFETTIPKNKNFSFEVFLIPGNNTFDLKGMRPLKDWK